MLQKLFVRLLGLFGSYFSNSDENNNSIRGILSFFPSHWTEELVAEKIYESLQNLIQMPELMPCGHYKLLGITKENLVIESILQDGKIIKAYPALNYSVQ